MTDSSGGFAILFVLGVLAALGFALAALFHSPLAMTRYWQREANWFQALYSAESGIATALEAERARMTGDLRTSKAKSLGDTATWATEISSEFPMTFSSPEVDGQGIFLDLRSTGTAGEASVTVEASFGILFDSALLDVPLVLSGPVVLDPLSFPRITGKARVKTPNAGFAAGRELPLDSGSALDSSVQAYSGSQFQAFSAELNELLANEGGEAGNGTFSPAQPPDFGKDGIIAFPLGDIRFSEAGGNDFLIRGPGKICAHGDIRIDGRTRMENLSLYAGRSVFIEGKARLRKVEIFAGRNVHLSGTVNVDARILAGGDIMLDGEAKTSLRSILVSAGATGAVDTGTGNRQASGILIKDQALAAGLLMAGGAGGTIEIRHPGGRIQGTALAGKEARLQGELQGALVTKTLRCDETPEHNCLGNGRIVWRQEFASLPFPVNFPLPSGRGWNFKLVDWQTAKAGP